MATYGTITALVMSNPYGRDGDNKIEINWTADTGGDAGKVTCDICAEYNSVNSRYGINSIQPSKLTGFIRKIVTNPGSTAPTAAYDITLLDADGVDVAGGTLADRSATLSESVVPAQPIYVDSELTLTITNAGDSKIGKITLYMSCEG